MVHHRAVRRATFIWLTTALAIGGATALLVHLYGAGPLRDQAPWLGVIAGFAAYLGRYIRLTPPTDRHSRSRASLTPRGKRWLMVLLGLGTVAALGWAVWQGLRGYETLTPAMLISDAEPPDSGFFIAEGKPQLEALYRLGGRDGERFLVPLDTFEGRLLVIADREPPTVAVRVSGWLKSELRAVQTADPGAETSKTEVLGPADPAAQGPAPFLPQYREHLRLPADARVWFLDTGVRAGLNLTTVLLVLVPGYLFLLTMGAPTRTPGPRMTVPRRGAARRPRTPQRGRR